MRNPLTYIRTEKRFIPTKKLRYATGLGDVVSAILHSKLIGPITYMLTGKIEPCATCNSRRIILNQLFPIKVWSYFFDTYEDVHEDIKKQYKKENVDYVYSSTAKDTNNLSIKYNLPPQPSFRDHPAYQKEGYVLLGKKGAVTDDGFTLIETFTYQKL